MSFNSSSCLACHVTRYLNGHVQLARYCLSCLDQLFQSGHVTESMVDCLRHTESHGRWTWLNPEDCTFCHRRGLVLRVPTCRNHLPVAGGPRAQSGTRPPSSNQNADSSDSDQAQNYDSDNSSSDDS